MLRCHCDICDKVVERNPVIVTSANVTLKVEFWNDDDESAGHLCIPCLKKEVAGMEEK